MFIDENSLKNILNSLQGLKFGEVILKVQDSRIVQIEKVEKFRIDKAGPDFREANTNISTVTDQKTGGRDA